MSREVNRAAVLRLIGAAGPIARNRIAERLGLSPATVTSLTRELLDRGLLRVVDRVPSRRGRPAVLLELVGGAATAFGVKIAPDHVVGVHVDLDAEILERFFEPLDVTAADAVDRITALLVEWTGARKAGTPVLGVGLGVPGVVDPAHGTLNSPMLGWRDLRLGAMLRRRLGVPVLVDNDVNTLAVFERLYGRGRAVDSFATVTLGRGVGLGLILNGDIYRGFGGGAGEFGHVTAVPDGPVCSCGKRGCLEAAVADPALVAEARRRSVISRRAGIDKLRSLADGGDAGAVEIFGDAATILGRSVADLVNVLSPELVLISGEGSESWSHLAARFERSFRANLFPPLAGVSVEIDPWDDTKWAVGAAALVLRATFTPLLDESGQDGAASAWVRAQPAVHDANA